MAEHAEATIRELERHASQIMKWSKAPKCLWNYFCLLVSRIKGMTANAHYLANGRAPHEIEVGETHDVSDFTAFEWYPSIWYVDIATFPDSNKNLGRWIGASHRVGQAMCFWIRTEAGTVNSRSSLCY